MQKQKENYVKNKEIVIFLKGCTLLDVGIFIIIIHKHD